MWKKKPNGYWDNWNNLLNEIKKFKEKYSLEELPISEKIKKLGHSSLLAAIGRHGGMPKIRTVLGEELYRRQNGVWTLDYSLEEVKKIKKKFSLKSLPSPRVLERMGFGDLVNAINRSVGFQEFRNLLKEKSPKIKYRLFQDVQTAVNYAINFMKMHNLSQLPSYNKLKKLGEGPFAASICRYHGYDYLRQCINERLGVLPHQNPLESILDTYVGEENE